jgi:hypothetical protein
VFRDSFANSGGAFAKVFAETAHPAAECSTGMKRPAVFHVLAKTPATMTDAQAGLFVLVLDSAMPAPAKIAAYAPPPSMADSGIALRKGVARVCAKL